MYNKIIYIFLASIIILFIIDKFIIITQILLKRYNNNNNNNNNDDCRDSTIDNPIQNVLYNELNKESCKIENEKILNNLKYNIYYDSKDIFSIKNNIRQIIQMPSAIYPNNINKFKSYLYNFNNSNCKLNSINCISTYRDIKYI